MSKFNIVDFNLSTRIGGQHMFEKLDNFLQSNEKVVLDFSEANPTPGGLDQSIGQLVKKLGWDEFKRRVAITSVSESTRSLLKVIVFRNK